MKHKISLFPQFKCKLCIKIKHMQTCKEKVWFLPFGLNAPITKILNGINSFSDFLKQPNTLNTKLSLSKKNMVGKQRNFLPTAGKSAKHVSTVTSLQVISHSETLSCVQSVTWFPLCRTPLTAVITSFVTKPVFPLHILYLAVKCSQKVMVLAGWSEMKTTPQWPVLQRIKQREVGQRK